MLSFGIKSNLDQVSNALDAMAQKQIPYATMLTLNRLADFSKSTLTTSMRSVFDRPTPYTMNSLYIRYAKKDKLEARVEHKDYAGKGTPASKYLRPEIEGGSRGEKRSEVVLSRMCGVPGGFWVPAPGVRLDAYGNVPGSLITRILSVVGGLSNSGFSGNATAASIARRKRQMHTFVEYFIMPINNPRRLKPGVYQRKANKIVPVLFVVPRVKYHARYDFYGIIGRVIASEFDRQFAANMDYALSTAKIKLKG